MQKLKQKLGENTKTTERNITTNRNNSKKNRNTGFPAHEPPRKINISKGLAGICFFFLYFILLFCLFVLCFPYSFYVVVCCYMCCFDCKCKSLKRLGENINKKQTKTT